MADPYVYPGTNVLRNLLGIEKDADLLQALERVSTAQRLEEPLPDVPISYEGYRALHRHLFEDIYEWAGQPRIVNLFKGGTPFALAAHVDKAMEQRFAVIQGEGALRGLEPARFATRAAEHVSEINAIHPFREGNGRTQRAFLKVLAHQAGLPLDVARIEPAAWHVASVEGFEGNYWPMEAVICTALGMTQEPFEQWAGIAPAEQEPPQPEAPSRPIDIDR